MHHVNNTRSLSSTNCRHSCGWIASSHSNDSIAMDLQGPLPLLWKATITHLLSWRYFTVSIKRRASDSLLQTHCWRTESSVFYHAPRRILSDNGANMPVGHAWRLRLPCLKCPSCGHHRKTLMKMTKLNDAKVH